MATKKKEKTSSPKGKNVGKSLNKGKDGQQFPGYPKYSADEDITRQAKRVDENLDDEVLTKVKHHKEPKVNREEGDNVIENTEAKPKGDFEVTDEDLEALGPKDLSLDMGDDEQLKHRTRPVDFAGTDLDVPGSELDDEQEENGSEDEENNNYSLGGDDKENLREGQEHEGTL